MFDSLFSPITINGMILKNRIVAAPTSDLYEEKALGGAGMVIAGHTIVEPGRSSFKSGDEPWLFDKYEREDTRRRVLGVHRGGAKASIELIHCGCHARVVDFAMGPDGYVREDGVEVRAMDEALMGEVVEWFQKSAVAARKIGFDSVFLHFGHGWLPDQFLSPFYNHRTNEYGGSAENRRRFPLRILAAVREAVGPRYPIDMRVSANQWVEGGSEFEDVLDFLREAQRYVDMVQVSCGIDINTVANVHTVTTNLEDETPNLGYARRVKGELDIPVAVVGAFDTPQLADDAIARGDVDLVAFGRSLIADPNWPNKARDGRVDDIAPCLRCSNCYHISSDHWNVGCSVNPRFNNEDFVPSVPAKADATRRVVVVGGGPAGMKAAITAAQRGHQVTLLEREGELGGMLRFVAQEAHKVEVARLLSHLRTQVEKSGVDVRLGCEATPELVASLKPDAVCVALGATERRPPVAGVDGPNVLTGTQAIERVDSLGRRVVVLGGGSVGCEIALELAESGREVTVIEMADALAGNANSLYREALRQKFELHDNIRVELGSRCTDVSGSVARWVDADGRSQEASFDQLVVSTGLADRTHDAERFYEIARNTVAIGDCTHPSSIMNAIFEGYSFGLEA